MSGVGVAYYQTEEVDGARTNIRHGPRRRVRAFGGKDALRWSMDLL